MDNLGFAIVLPYLYFYVLALGGSPFLYGIILASYSFLSFIFSPLIARMSDRYGRRRILLVALTVSGFSYILFGSAQVLWLLFTARMIAGTTAATVPVAQAYVADVTDRQNRLRYLGLLSASAGIAFLLGPAIGGTLSDLFGYAVPSYIAAGLAFANLVSTFLGLPEPVHGKAERTKSVVSSSALRRILGSPQIRVLFAMYFLFFVAFVFLQSALSPWLELTFGFGSFGTGIVFFFLGGVSVFTQAVLLPRLSKTRSRFTLASWAAVAFVGGLFGLSAVQGLVWMFAAAAVISFGFGIQYVTLNTLISLNAPMEAQGGTLGAAWALAALGQTVGPVFSAAVFSFGVSVGFSGLVFLVSALIALAAIPLFLVFRRVYSD